MRAEIRVLKAGEEAVFGRVGPEVFDYAVDPALAREFLADPHHHIAVAIDDGTVVAFASGVDYVHPDKPREMFVNEVGTASSHRGQGLAKKAVAALLDHARTLGCRVAWVLTDADNAAARALYRSAGGIELKHDTVHVEWQL
jgi:ribosomal protein S18 acetylase RimI-like enzyme